MDTGKTSTFIVDHDRCDPSKWTPDDVLALKKFIANGGDIRYAATLARLGLQLVASEHYVPKGGDMAPVGWAEPDWQGEYAETVDELDIDWPYAPVRPIYAGPIQYAVLVPTSSDGVCADGHEIELKPSEEAAQACVDAMMADPATRLDAAGDAEDEA